MILRAVGDYKDTFDAATGKITRNVGVKVLDGTEDWVAQGVSGANDWRFRIDFSTTTTGAENSLCTHMEKIVQNADAVQNTRPCIRFPLTGGALFWYSADNTQTLAQFQQYLADQYAAGTPVIIYYPLATPVIEDWDGGATYCETGIKIATNLYNSAKFQNVIDALDTAVSTINNIVAGTIAQANSISELASGKQTRPNPADSSDTTCPTSCPNYRQCLLVEKDDGTPCWYEISDPFRDFAAPIVGTNTNPTSTTNASGYTQLEYIESTGAQYIDTGIPSNSNMQTEVSFSPTDWGGAVFGNYSDNGLAQNSNTLYIAPQPLDYLYTTDYGSELDGNINRTKIGDISLDTVYNVTIDWKNRRGIFDNTVIPFVSQEVWQGTTNQVLFARTSGAAGTVGYYGKLKLYYAKIWNNGTLVRDFVPVRQNSTTGKYGLYDKVNGVFYPNAASSGADFTPGPEVLNQDPDVPGRLWTATWQANQNGVEAGVISGTGRCTSVEGANNYTSTNPTKYSELTAANQTAWNTAFTASTVSNYKYCWCKISNLAINNEKINPGNSNYWVYNRVHGSSELCATNCADRCALNIKDTASFRKALLGF